MKKKLHNTFVRSQILRRSFWALPLYTRSRSRATSISSSSSPDNDFAEMSLVEIERGGEKSTTVGKTPFIKINTDAL